MVEFPDIRNSLPCCVRADGIMLRSREQVFSWRSGAARWPRLQDRSRRRCARRLRIPLDNSLNHQTHGCLPKISLRSLHSDDVDALDQPLEQAPVSRSDSTCDDASLLDRLMRRIACRELRLQRNLIAHGVRMVNDAGIPHVTWHSHFLESDDYAVVRSFSYEGRGYCRGRRCWGSCW